MTSNASIYQLRSILVSLRLCLPLSRPLFPSLFDLVADLQGVKQSMIFGQPPVPDSSRN